MRETEVTKFRRADGTVLEGGGGGRQIENRCWCTGALLEEESWVILVNRWLKKFEIYIVLTDCGGHCDEKFHEGFVLFVKVEW